MGQTALHCAGWWAPTDCPLHPGRRGGAVGASPLEAGGGLRRAPAASRCWPATACCSAPGCCAGPGANPSCAVVLLALSTVGCSHQHRWAAHTHHPTPLGGGGGARCAADVEHAHSTANTICSPRSPSMPCPRPPDRPPIWSQRVRAKNLACTDVPGRSVNTGAANGMSVAPAVQARMRCLETGAHGAQLRPGTCPTLASPTWVFGEPTPIAPTLVLYPQAPTAAWPEGPSTGGGATPSIQRVLRACS